VNRVKFPSRLARKPDNKKLPETSVLLHQFNLADKSIYSSFYRIPQGFLFRFTSIGDFYVDRGGHLIATHAETNVSKSDLELTYSEEVLPHLLSLQKRLVLHAAAININNSAVAFASNSGLGKSTLAASFAICGHQLLTDDVLLLEKTPAAFQVQPGQALIQIYPDSHKVLFLQNSNPVPKEDNLHKLAVTADSDLVFCDHALPLHSLYSLGPGSGKDIIIRELSSQQAIMSMSLRTYWLDPEHRELREFQFRQLGELAQKVRCFHLDFPRQYEWLPKVREALISHVNSIQ